MSTNTLIRWYAESQHARVSFPAEEDALCHRWLASPPIGSQKNTVVRRNTKPNASNHDRPSVPPLQMIPPKEKLARVIANTRSHITIVHHTASIFHPHDSLTAWRIHVPMTCQYRGASTLSTILPVSINIRSRNSLSSTHSNPVLVAWRRETTFRRVAAQAH